MTRPSDLFPEFADVTGLDEAYAERYPFAAVARAVMRVRGELGLTQTEFATRLGTTQSVVARLESGRHGIQVSLLNRIAEAFGLEWDPTFARPEAEHATGDHAGTYQPSGDELLDAFNLANIAGDVVAATRVADRIRRRPTSARRKLALALDAFNHRRYQLGLRRSEEAIAQKLPPTSGRVAAVVAGRSLLALAKPAAALERLEAVADEPRVDPVVDAARAEALIDLGRADEAAGLVERWLAAADVADVPTANFLAARVYWHANRPFDALAAVGAFRAFDAESREGLELHGAILGYIGDHEADSACYERALELFERVHWPEAETLRLHAVTAGRLGRWRVAFPLAERSVQAAAARLGNKGATGFSRAATAVAEDCFGRLNDSEELDAAADDAWKRGLIDDDVRRSQRAFCIALRGDFAGAVHALGLTTHTLGQASPNDQIRCASAFFVRGEWAKAYPILRDNLAHLSDPEGVLLFAKAALAAGDTTRARDVLRSVTEGDGTTARIAEVALDLVEAIEAGAQHPFARIANRAADASAQWIALTDYDVAAPDSSWEGPADLRGEPMHDRPSLVMEQFTRDRLSQQYVH